MTLEASVLRDDSLRRTPDGYAVDLYLAWYRSLPLSCVEDVQIELGGTPLTAEDLRFLVGEESLRLSQLADRVDDEWFVQDPLTVTVPDPAPRDPGEEIDLAVTMATRIPYILIGPQQALVKPTRVRRRVVIR
jgi:hypothetical protein